jgi:hypothetical protein
MKPEDFDFWVEKERRDDGTIVIEPWTRETAERRPENYPDDPRIVFLRAAWEIIEFPREAKQ